jgi:hypothetical protein
MARTTYALLVGIEGYEKPLVGCRADVEDVARMLEERNVDGTALRIERLFDEEATVAAILDRLVNHLGQAEREDTALFYFSGHGSQCLVPEGYANVEPDGKLETLVAWDSRRPGGRDLYDLELARALAGVAASGAHLVAVIDACHSGHADRRGEAPGWQVKQLPTPKVAKAVPSLELQQAARWALENPVHRRPPHVSLLACAAHQRSWILDWPLLQRRGSLFTRALIETLDRLEGVPTYDELFSALEIEVGRQELTRGARLGRQTPVLRRQNRSLFLSNQIEPRPPKLYLRFGADRTWRLDGGRFDGLRVGDRFALETAQVGAEPPGLVLEIERPWSTSSSVRLVTGDPPTVPLLPVIALGQASTHLDRGRSSDPPALAIDAENHELRVLGEASRLLTPPIALSASTRLGTELAVRDRLRHWTSLAALRGSSRSLRGHLDLLFEVPGLSSTQLPRGLGQLDLAYLDTEADRPGQPPRFAVRIENRSQLTVDLVLLGLDENFGVTEIASESGFEPGQQLRLGGDPGFTVTVPDPLYALGVTSRRDLLLLLIANGPLPSRRWVRDPIVHLGQSLSDSSLTPVVAPDLLGNPRNRRATAMKLGAYAGQSWAVRRRWVRTFRPAPRFHLDGSGEPVVLPGGALVHPPRGLVGWVRPHSQLGLRRFAFWLSDRARRGAPGLSAAPFSTPLGTDPGLSALEIHTARGSWAGGRLTFEARIETTDPLVALVRGPSGVERVALGRPQGPTQLVVDLGGGRSSFEPAWISFWS